MGRRLLPDDLLLRKFKFLCTCRHIETSRKRITLLLFPQVLSSHTTLYCTLFPSSHLDWGKQPTATRFCASRHTPYLLPVIINYFPVIHAALHLLINPIHCIMQRYMTTYSLPIKESQNHRSSNYLPRTIFKELTLKNYLQRERNRNGLKLSDCMTIKCRYIQYIFVFSM